MMKLSCRITKHTYKKYLYLVSLSFSVMMLSNVSVVSAETTEGEIAPAVDQTENQLELFKEEWKVPVTESTLTSEESSQSLIDETEVEQEDTSELLVKEDSMSNQDTTEAERLNEEVSDNSIHTSTDHFLDTESDELEEKSIEDESVEEESIEVETFEDESIKDESIEEETQTNAPNINEWDDQESEVILDVNETDGLLVDDEVDELIDNELKDNSTIIAARSVSLPINQWVFNETDATWEYLNENGVVAQRLTVDGYWIDDVKQKDKHIAINGKSYYFDTNGNMIQNKWVYSDSMLAWFKANDQGVLVNEITPWGHYVNGNQLFDILATIQSKTYYFEPLDWGGFMSMNKWAYSPNANSWYQSDNKGEVYEYVTPTYYSKNGIEEKDKHISIHGTSYYYDTTGERIQDKLTYSESMMAWFKANTKGILTNEVTPWGHYVNGNRLFDSLVEISNRHYYFEPADWGGNMSMNKWAYSPSKNSWYRSNDKGETLDFVTPSSYLKNGIAQKDAHISIHGAGYYFEPTGKMAQNKWVYSHSMLAWFQANNNGLLTSEVTPWGHYVNGHQRFDILTSVYNQQYYFEPAEWGGFMAMNKWSYSPNANSWYRSKQDGVTVELVTPNAYVKNSVTQKDEHISINGISYYYEPTGKLAQNKWIYSNGMSAWFQANNKGVLVTEITPWGYFQNGNQHFDTVATANNNKRYYFVSRALGGTMSMDTWSQSSSTNLWYQSNVKGEIIYQDKVGPILPSYVSLDKGQWKMYQQWQDGWPTGCWARTAASGISFAGGNVTPQMIVNNIPRTDDPRTGMLSHPSISNNWALGGAYSQAAPSALMPYIKQHAPNSEDITGASFEQIKRELANGNTVQIYYAWVTPNIELNVNNGLGSFKASKDYHSVLLTGYDNTGFYHQEHWSNEPARNNHFSFSSLGGQYNNMEKKAIAYRPN